MILKELMNGKVYQLMVGCGKEEYEDTVKRCRWCKNYSLVAKSSRYYTGKRK